MRPYTQVFDATKTVLLKLEFEIIDASPEQEFVIARKHASFWSYGERIEITFEHIDGITEVVIHSFSVGIQLIDFGGSNEKNEEQIVNELNRFLN